MMLHQYPYKKRKDYQALFLLIPSLILALLIAVLYVTFRK
jgi:hypothetical protein